MADAGRIFTASNGVSLAMPGGWPTPDSYSAVMACAGALPRACAEARAAGHRVSLADQIAACAAAEAARVAAEQAAVAAWRARLSEVSLAA